MRHSSLSSTALITLAALLGGCAVGPNYSMPTLSSPANWLGLSGSHLTESEAPIGNLQWWQAFDDTVLNELIERGIKANGNLRVAKERVTQARANRLGATAALLPNINGSVSGQRQQISDNAVTETSSAGLGASWEIDLFGGGRRAAEAARANVEVAKASYKQVRVSLLAEIARNYLDVRQLQEQLEFTRRNLDIQNETLRIVRVQYQEGVVSQLNVAQAESQVATTRAQLPAAEQALTASLNNLGVLVGMQPAEINKLLSPATGVPVSTPDVLVSTPAAVLAERPDVRVAERTLAAATANQGVALSNWFPSISLTGLFGLSPLGSNSQGLWQAGGSVSLPLIDFGRVRALVRSADAEQRAALATYEQTVLAALADVETALRGYVNAQRRLVDLQAAAVASQNATRLAQIRYQEGVASLLDVLSAQAQQLTVETSLAQAKGAAGQTLATLYAALGGGTTASATAPAPAPTFAENK